MGFNRHQANEEVTNDTCSCICSIVKRKCDCTPWNSQGMWQRGKTDVVFFRKNGILK